MCSARRRTSLPPVSAVKTFNDSLAVLRVFFARLRATARSAATLRAARRAHGERIKLPPVHREMDSRGPAGFRAVDACGETSRPLAETLIATGLRISEALALTWDDVDFPARTLRVLRSRKADGRGSTKGDRFRSVDFGARLETVLRAIRPTVVPAADTLVFRGPRGGELSRSDVSRDLHKHALEDAGLRRRLRLHDLRHTAAASWLAVRLPLI